MAIDVNDLKNLPPRVKILLVCLLFLVMGYLYFMLYLQGALERHGSLGVRLADFQRQVTEKQKAVSQLDKYRRDVGALKEDYRRALMMLPNQKEIPDLLLAVADAGRAAGVDFLVFEPNLPAKKPPATAPAAAKPPPAKPTVSGAAKAAEGKGQAGQTAEPEKFYEDIPIKVQIAGGFHNTLSFFGQVARLPRIVNVEDIAMGDAKEARGRGRIVKTSCTVKTYMFVDKQ